ncbi:hypothetical protein CYLTODRAFT_492035 [Cylindrobasidium torrendii FP15055 ss-10]|uniref:HNH nuclease domain-containing protein n=1 Tax=Cylindrobasidium torrendii FP15055 ss-10 TaxID=1314674 RepID=A0A0D7B8E9_9AGAR|nr:hypothetical protein CYLTODRAFT_492035 [Cylindrobasidium torrendii FP15055 ss-10]
MRAIHRPQDISTCPIFENSVCAELLCSSGPILRIEYMLGLGLGNLQENLDCQDNSIDLQPRMHTYFTTGDLFFLPSEEVLERILQLSRYNMTCAPDERVLFSEDVKSGPSACTYMLDFRKLRWNDHILYTRHPNSGQVTAHTSPYPDLPPFVLPASPWIAALSTHGALNDNDNLLVPQIEMTMFSARLPRSFGMARPRPPNQPARILKTSVSSTTDPICKKPAPSKRKRNKRPIPYPVGSDESSRSSEDELRAKKRPKVSRKSKAVALGPRDIANAVCHPA